MNVQEAMALLRWYEKKTPTTDTGKTQAEPRAPSSPSWRAADMRQKPQFHPSARNYALAGIIVALWLIAGTIDAEPTTVNLTADDCSAGCYAR